MRRGWYRAGAPALLGVLLLGGCESILGPGGDAPETLHELPRDLSGQEAEAIAASNAFGFDLLRRLVEEKPDRSVFMSPVSASMVLAMLLNGADGETFEGIREALRLEGSSEEEINAAYRDLIQLLRELDPGVELDLGNSVWYRDGLALADGFRERTETYFDARVQGLDFGRDGAADVINQWVRDATRDRIQEMVDPPIPADVIAYLLNAIYFKASWTDRFDPDDTHTGDFHLPDGSTGQAEFMHAEKEAGFFRDEELVAADLPYGRQAFSMTVLVPRGETTIHDLVTSLDAERWETLTGAFPEPETMSDVRIHLPRFELEWGEELNTPLAAMGMDAAFDPDRADLSRMFEGSGGYLDKVEQKSFVRVDEEGTEAAAVTKGAVPISAPPEVRADRPFVFAIRERLSGTILFAGVMLETPTP